MDPPPFTPSEKCDRGGIVGSGGEEPVGRSAAVGLGLVQGHGYGVRYLNDPASQGVGPFPSACDVLQPLSQLSPLPSSGYLAAVLARERSHWTKQASGSDGHLVPLSPGCAASAPAHDHRSATPPAVRMDDRVGDSSSEAPTHGSMVVSDPRRQPGTPAPVQCHANPIATSHEQGVPSIANLIGSHPSQNCGYAVQYLHDADEEGLAKLTDAHLAEAEKMTLTDYASYPDSPDLAALNLSRLVARLEHNLLSSAADLKPLRRSEYQRMRVGANTPAPTSKPSNAPFPRSSPPTVAMTCRPTSHANGRSSNSSRLSSTRSVVPRRNLNPTKKRKTTP
ncbi:uncharacterized protein BO96DRAFT_431919 [Aspergillus niger CBS 101883]|uniref:uncharacterized protein n=1 Tax=Aspergillus lacticoffeatus (strain CBS 101883) TaxID=1450533 RepID=UPI000D80548B|nr:uncharacterized protein BO96DRAFT_431919 [Aspergillus niger CBS 101883]PYH58815.1 hypothetical protein BO96DRAFT_431919 [Aspergillus niger CBS 101883]